MMMIKLSGCNDAVKREQKQTCLHLAEREHLRRFSTAKVRRFRQTGFSI